MFLLLYTQQSSVYFICVNSFDLHRKVDAIINSTLQMKKLKQSDTYLAKGDKS